MTVLHGAIMIEKIVTQVEFAPSARTNAVNEARTRSAMAALGMNLNLNGAMMTRLNCTYARGLRHSWRDGKNDAEVGIGRGEGASDYRQGLVLLLLRIRLGSYHRHRCRD